jgi:hypothetical protein
MTDRKTGPHIQAKDRLKTTSHHYSSNGWIEFLQRTYSIEIVALTTQSLPHRSIVTQSPVAATPEYYT